MPKRHIFDSEVHAQFITFSCYHRRRLLDHPQLRDVLLVILSEKLNAHRGICCGYVVMPDHVHLILWLPHPGDLSRFMKAWKQTSSLKLKSMLHGLLPKYASTIPKADPFWQPRYYPLNLYSESKAREKVDYMHLNPVKAGLVLRAIDWKWSSARHYELAEPTGVPLQWIF